MLFVFFLIKGVTQKALYERKYKFYTQASISLISCSRSNARTIKLFCVYIAGYI